MAESESALVVLNPETEFLVKPFRDQYDPSAAAGMSAHITLLFPFLSPQAISPAVMKNLQSCFSDFKPFDFSFSATKRFPEVLYFEPEPDEPFRQLTLAIWDRYPDNPPYGGRHPDIKPHLCLALLQDEKKLNRIAEDFARASETKVPIRAKAHEVALMNKIDGRWRVTNNFTLGQAA